MFITCDFEARKKYTRLLARLLFNDALYIDEFSRLKNIDVLKSALQYTPSKVVEQSNSRRSDIVD